MTITTILAFIKKFFKIICWVAVLLGIGVLVLLILHNIQLKNKISIYKSNEKAFLIELDSSKLQNRELQLTVDDLDLLNDSISIKMNALRKELNIKDKNLVSLQYLLSHVHALDTIMYKDTIFLPNIIQKDTTVANEWYTLNMSLMYPNKIVVNPIFKSEKYIIMSNKRETIDAPKKFFLLRWFQKKHTVVTIDVMEKSPYIDNNKYRYIEIIK